LRESVIKSYFYYRRKKKVKKISGNGSYLDAFMLYET